MPIQRHLSAFRTDESGTIALLWVSAIVAVIGLVSLSFDIGRMNATHSELQSFADNVALAAAAELDGQGDAITRATSAAANLVADSQTFGSGDGILSGPADYTLTFHTKLPASDLTPLGADVTTVASKAAFAQVVAAPVSLTLPFLRAVNSVLGKGSDPVTANLGAEAVAGFTQEACDITPLMFCLPAPVAPETSYKAENHRGDQILLRTGGSGAAWGPGDFGFLDPSSANLGATCAGENGLNNIVICLIGAAQNITSCYSQRGVDIQPGQAVGVWNDAFNMRFDRYSSSLNKLKSDPDYQPAPTIISGQTGGCGNTGVSSSTNSIGLPHDSCFASGTCTRFGDGTWDYEKYIGWNYGTPGYATGTTAYDASWDDHLTAFTVDAAAGSRYETYLREIAYLKSLAAGSTLLTGRDETGVAQCYTGPKTVAANRRVVIAAGIDCTANSISGAATNVPVAEFFELFLTDPVGTGTGSPGTFDLYAEVIGSAGLAGYTSAGDGGIFRDVVQLYR